MTPKSEMVRRALTESALVLDMPQVLAQAPVTSVKQARDWTWARGAPAP